MYMILIIHSSYALGSYRRDWVSEWGTIGSRFWGALATTSLPTDHYITVFDVRFWSRTLGSVRVGGLQLHVSTRCEVLCASHLWVLNTASCVGELWCRNKFLWVTPSPPRTPHCPSLCHSPLDHPLRNANGFCPNVTSLVHPCLFHLPTSLHLTVYSCAFLWKHPYPYFPSPYVCQKTLC